MSTIDALFQPTTLHHFIGLACKLVPISPSYPMNSFYASSFLLVYTNCTSRSVARRQTQTHLGSVRFLPRPHAFIHVYHHLIQPVSFNPFHIIHTLISRLLCRFPLRSSSRLFPFYSVASLYLLSHSLCFPCLFPPHGLLYLKCLQDGARPSAFVLCLFFLCLLEIYVCASFHPDFFERVKRVPNTDK